MQKMLGDRCIVGELIFMESQHYVRPFVCFHDVPNGSRIAFAADTVIKGRRSSMKACGLNVTPALQPSLDLHVQYST